MWNTMECKRDSFNGSLGGASETHWECVSHCLKYHRYKRIKKIVERSWNPSMIKVSLLVHLVNSIHTGTIFLKYFLQVMGLLSRLFYRRGPYVEIRSNEDLKTRLLHKNLRSNDDLQCSLSFDRLRHNNVKVP